MEINGIVALIEYREIDSKSVPVFKHGLEEQTNKIILGIQQIMEQIL